MATSSKEDLDARPMPFIVGLGWTLAATVASVILVSLTDAFREGAANDLVNVTLCFAASYLLILFAMLQVHAPNASIRERLGLQPTNPLILILAVVVGVGMAPGISRLGEWLEHRFPTPEDVTQAEAALFHATTKSAQLIRFASQVLVFPVVYEVFFRGMIQGTMRKSRPEDLALVNTAIFFSLGDHTSVPPRLLLGLITGWVRLRSTSTFASIAVHVAMCVFWFWPLRWDVDMTGDSSYPIKWVVTGGVAAAMALVLIGLFTRKSEQANAA